MEEGYPQGSSLDPTFWNVVMQGWFEALHECNDRWKQNEAELRDVDIEYLKS